MKKRKAVILRMQHHATTDITLIFIYRGVFMSMRAPIRMKLRAMQMHMFDGLTMICARMESPVWMQLTNDTQSCCQCVHREPGVHDGDAPGGHIAARNEIIR